MFVQIQPAYQHLISIFDLKQMQHHSMLRRRCVGWAFVCGVAFWYLTDDNVERSATTIQQNAYNKKETSIYLKYTFY